MFGSNIFDILFALGLPWVVATCALRHPVYVHGVRSRYTCARAWAVFVPGLFREITPTNTHTDTFCALRLSGGSKPLFVQPARAARTVRCVSLRYIDGSTALTAVMVAAFFLFAAHLKWAAFALDARVGKLYLALYAAFFGYCFTLK